jgi:CelD/BcsL family acetyltransferase involved in cellulose biosynthesis
MSLRVERILDLHGLRALETDWRRLEQRAACQLPFLTFDWATMWWEHMHEDKLAIRDELFVHVVRSAEGELVSIAPLMRTCRPGYGPVRFREVLERLLEDPALIERAGKLAHERVLANFTARSVAAAYTRLYTQPAAGEHFP